MRGGTIFLDEIDEFSLAIQTSLLRILQEREGTRLAESKPEKADPWVVAATHYQLEQDMEKGTF